MIGFCEKRNPWKLVAVSQGFHKGDYLTEEIFVIFYALTTDNYT